MRQLPVEPDAHGLADDVVGRHVTDLRETAVAAVVAVVAHEEVVTGRHHVVEVHRRAFGDVERPVLDRAELLRRRSARAACC